MLDNHSIHAGTSGRRYDHWKDRSYPETRSQNDYLHLSSEYFHAQRKNNSYDPLPSERLLVNLRDVVPDSFVFSVDTNRDVTYTKKLKDARVSLAPSLLRANDRGEKFGPILFRFPPPWRFSRSRLELFLKALPSGYRYAFEFRDASWFHPDTYALLWSHNAALSIYQVGARTSPQIVTADYVYIRLHGSKPASGEYDPDVLAEWAGTLSGLADNGKEIFCYFDGDKSGRLNE